MIDDGGNVGAAATTVKVHADNFLPVAALSVSLSAPRPGQTVTLTASAVDTDGTIARYEFDLDGDGTYEKDNARKSSVATSFPERERVRSACA